MSSFAISMARLHGRKRSSATLGEHFERFIAKQIKAGRFESKSEVIRAAMQKRIEIVRVLHQSMDVESHL